MTTTNSRVLGSTLLKAAAGLLAASAAFGTVSDAAAHDDCRSPHGPFTSYAVAPPDCPSPVGICTMGTLTGGFPSTYWFVMDTLAWGGDFTNPTKFVYTGHSVITDAKGRQIFGSDTGEMLIAQDPMASNPFVTTVHIVGGTKKYKHASGSFVATGSIVFATGLASGSYVSSICNGDDDDDHGHDDDGHCGDDDDHGHGHGHD